VALIRRLSATALPWVVLAAVSLASFAARLAFVGDPCQRPCRTASNHLLIFDESYYVNAARRIASLPVPAGDDYAHTPAGDDPNAEHPQLAKLVIAGAIELFGDGPFAWRIGSVLLGSLAILGIYALARAAGAGRWLGVGAAALMATDNLLLVHARIATLDIYVACAMIWAVAMYLRGRPWLAGVLLGVGAACKLVAPYALLVIALYELITAARSRRIEWRAVTGRLIVTTVGTAAVFLVLLAVMDQVAPPYNPVSQRLVGGGPFHHLAHIISYSASQTSPHGPRGIASYPWEWLVDYKPIVYLNINPSEPSPALYHVHPSTLFLGMISPPLMLLALPSLLLIAAALADRPRRLAGVLRERKTAGVADGPDLASGRTPEIALAWVLGTLGPFVVLSAFWQRTSYIYYMVIVMPGIYLSVAHLVVRLRHHRRWIGAWAVAVLLAAIAMYPFLPLR
jgi:4-amino-4-deoxy-L-arabinose transferase-like glycosyltransferase